MYEILILLLVIIDQISKYLAVNHIKYQESLPILKNFLHLTLIHNDGAAFGLFQGKQYVFAVVAFVIIFAGIFYIHRGTESMLARWACSMFVAGAIGNLIDRIRLGYVIDFIDFRGIWPYIFNMADVFVIIGAGIFIFQLVVEDMANKGEH